MTNTVNIPLLRKAVEWAEAEAAKPYELCEWYQKTWVVPTPESGAGVYKYSTTTAHGKAPECGTCYCIAGFVVATQDGPPRFRDPTAPHIGDRARELLGLTNLGADRLFSLYNTIGDIRRIAEDVAGEPL